MNIAIDIRNIGRNRTGSEVVVLQLVKKVLEKDHYNQYFLLTDTRDQHVLHYVSKVLFLKSKNNVKLVSLPSPHRVIWLFFSVAFFLRKARIDVFHTEYIVPFFIPSHICVLTHIHDVSFADPAIRPLISTKDLFILDRLMPRSLRRANHIIAVSHFTMNQIQKYYGYEAPKVVMIYNAAAYGTPEDDLPHVTTDAIVQKYSLPKKYIFALGTMQPRKNIPFLIEAFACVASKIPNTHLVLSGPRAKSFDMLIETTLKRYPDIAKRVHFTGYIAPADLDFVYGGAICTVHPSLYEGFGLPLLESFWAEVPVMASDIPAYREIAGGGALYFDPHEIDHCCEVLYTVCTDKIVRQEILSQAQKLRERFSWEVSADLFLDLYVRNPQKSS